MASNTLLPLVSIIVPCYNHGEYLPDALQSVLNQSYINWECLIINDASTDNSRSIAEEWELKDNRFKLIDMQLNQGLAASRNSGIHRSKGIYILPLDADDKISVSYIEKSISIFTNNSLLKVVYSDVVCFGDENCVVQRPTFKLEKMCYSNQIHCTAMFLKNDYDKTEGYRTNMKYGYEDWDFWMQLITSNDEVFKISEPLFWIRTKDNSMFRNLTNDKEKEFEMRKQLYFNNKKVFETYAPKIVEQYKKKQSITATLLDNIKKKIQL